MMPEKELIDRIEVIEKRLKEIDIMLEELEHTRAKTIMNMKEDLNNVHEYYKRRRD